MSLLYKISFDTKVFNLHESVEWLVSKNLNNPEKFTFNKYYYTFQYLDKNDKQYNGYKTKLSYDEKTGVIKCFLLPPTKQMIFI